VNWYRWVVCGLCLVIADGAWIYPLLGFMGFLAGLGHAPVTLAALEGVLLVSVFTSAIASIVSAASVVRVVKPAFAAVSVWMGVCLCAPRVGVDAGLAWPLELLAARYTLSEMAGLFTVTAVLAWCWWHAARRMGEGVGTPLIARGFRAGLVVMVTVLVFEAMGNLDLGTRAALAPFFIASLMGMALARAPAHGSRARAWLVLTGGAVCVILAVGVALGVMLVVSVRGGLAALWGVWFQLATAASQSVGETLHELLGTNEAEIEGVFQARSQEPADWFVMVVLLAGAAVMSALAHRLLRASRKQHPRMSLELGEEERESMDSADTRFVGKWMEALFRPWSRGKRAGPVADITPGESGIRESHRIYLRLLERARRKDIPINRAETPYQRAGVLSRAFPELPVDDITRAFVNARYGTQPPPADVLSALGRALDKD
jgi:hypothetical protein